MKSINASDIYVVMAIVSMEHYYFFIVKGIKQLALQVDNFEVWERPLSKNRLAVAVLNMWEIGGPRGFVIRAVPGWKICDPQCNVTQILPQYKEMGVQIPQSKMVLSVNPSGTALLTVTPISSDFNSLHKLHWQDTSVQRKRTIL